jgi:signal peptidase I
MLTLQHSGQLNTRFPSARFFHGLRIVAIGRNPKLTLARIAVLVATSLVLFHYILLPIRVTGISMLPTYKDRSVNFVNRLAYRWHSPKRGDVVSIRLAEAAEINLTFMKRIVGLPGETVAFSNGCVLINGQPLDEPYLKFPCDWNRPPVRLTAGECFVVGDNRSMPSEDHWFGKVTLTRIIGKVLL